MKRLVGVTMAVLLVGGLATLAMAQGWGPMGRGPMSMGAGGGPMGGGMGMMSAGPGGSSGCPGWAAASAAPGDATAPVTEDKAKAIATEYAAKYFAGYTVERVLPFQGRRHTAYQAELKGPKGETRTLHVNPWGGVRPFTASE